MQISGLTTLGLSEYRGSPIDNAAIPLNSGAVWDWVYGGERTASGEQINEANALQITTVYACVRCISEAGASLPLKVWERTPKGHREAVESNLYYLLMVAPNPEMSAFTWKETTFGGLALTGNAYSEIERNALGLPVALWPLLPQKTTPKRINNRIVYETSDGMTGGTRIIEAENMLHFMLFSFDGLKGISPVGLARQSLGLAKAAEKFGARFFGNGSRPSGLLINKGPKPSESAKKEIRESWNREQGGGNQGSMGFLFGGEWIYQQTGLSPEESQFLATRQFSRAEIAALFRLSPHYVGDTSRLSGSNAEQMNLQFVTDTLRPYLCRFEGEIHRKLMPTVGRNAGRHFVQFDVSERLRGDFKTQQEGFAAGRQWGWFSGNDVLRKMGENPGPPALDVYLVPVNMQNAEMLLKTRTAESAPSDGDDTDGDDVDDGNVAPDDTERQLLGSYAQAYIRLYSDAFRQLLVQEKRDLQAIMASFRPVLTSLTEAVIERGDSSGAGADGLRDVVVADVMKAMAKRSAKWPKTASEELTLYLAGQEFNRAVRRIRTAVEACSV